jgi:hypothetical protein
VTHGTKHQAGSIRCAWGVQLRVGQTTQQNPSNDGDDLSTITNQSVRRDSTDPSERPRRRLTTETKAAYKTTEFIAYVVAVVGVLLASQLVGTEDNHADYFRADRAWFYIVLLTIGYLISRGLAKAGSRDAYDD